MSDFLPHIARMAGYVPGEQPRMANILKLNTNENPYPPSPRVAEAISAALAADRLRRYPDPVGSAFRETAARLHGVKPEMILAGNGSDDLLTIITRAFAGPGDLVISPTPSYILYRTLAELQNARIVEIPFEADWSLDPARFCVPEAKLAFIPNPNSPSGTAIPNARLAEIAGKLSCPLVIDEAYVDFADDHAIGLVRDYPNVIVTRSFSKGYGLAGLRLGYLIAQPEIVEGLTKVKDSYNCDTLSLVGGVAALEDQEYRSQTCDKVRATRARLAHAMGDLGYHVPKSQANFAWCPDGPPAGPIYEGLKEQGILVRLMTYQGHAPGLRITVGTDDAIDRLLTAIEPLIRAQ